MKIHFDNVSISAKTGPNVFASRLAKSLLLAGHEIEFENTNSDISLVFIEPSGNKLANKVVQRLDGIWFKPEEFQHKNKNIKSLYDKADGIIFQSNFDKEMIKRLFSIPSPMPFCKTIYNGIEILPKKELSYPQLQNIRNSYEKIYVCSANWHKQKRLSANIDLFNILCADTNSCLFVMGSNPDTIVSSPNIYYTGSVPSDVYLEIFAMADWMLHLAWADHCPNVIVEALSQGTPVVCSSVGGTKELIGNYGVVLEDKKYNYELYDYDNPPKLEILNNLKLPTRKELDYSSIANIDIQHTAKEYIAFFEKVIQGCT
jgi:glycosyltransferase involved in cell wall biosynthesis